MIALQTSRCKISLRGHFVEKSQVTQTVATFMPSTLNMDSLLTEAMTWPLEDRLEAAERLVASVPCDAAIEKVQLEEVRRRIAEDRAGRTVCVSGPEALKQVRRVVLGGA
jgi:hypothetical protein